MYILVWSIIENGHYFFREWTDNDKIMVDFKSFASHDQEDTSFAYGEQVAATVS
jgi:hypothetical protein